MTPQFNTVDGVNMTSCHSIDGTGVDTYSQ